VAAIPLEHEAIFVGLPEGTVGDERSLSCRELSPLARAGCAEIERSGWWHSLAWGHAFDSPRFPSPMAAGRSEHRHAVAIREPARRGRAYTLTPTLTCRGPPPAQPARLATSDDRGQGSARHEALPHSP
jgi:hypothetical protein